MCRCQQDFLSFFNFFHRVKTTTERRRRDLNPRAAVNDLHPFQGCPFGQLGYFSKMLELTSSIYMETKRRGWDSNPRALSDKRFSRPPRYDRFDTSPYIFFNCSSLISDVVYNNKLTPEKSTRKCNIFQKNYRSLLYAGITLNLCRFCACNLSIFSFIFSSGHTPVSIYSSSIL